MTLSKAQVRFKHRVAAEYADLVYNGLWFSPLKIALDAFIEKTQELVTGKVKLLFKGSAVVVGRDSPYSLYSTSLSTYAKGDEFDHSAAKGFIYVWGLPLKVASLVKANGHEGGVDENAVEGEFTSVCK